MRVIDLLNKIANGEEVPEKIKYRNNIFIYDKNNQCYVVENYNEDYDLHMSLSNYRGTDLNYEIEIIEEDPEDEEIREHHDIFDYFTGYSFGETNKELLQQLEHNFQIVNEELEYLINKINS